MFTDSQGRSKRFHGFGDDLRRRYGCRVYKVPLDAGFTCPNRDGTVAVGGCTFCNNRSFSPTTYRGIDELRQQLTQGMAHLRRRYGATRFIAYFQAFTNTYAPLETLRRLYDAALQPPEVIGLCIGTRPDCAPEPTLDLISSYQERCEVWIEYGLQSIHDDTLRAINRGHDAACFLDAVQRTRRRGLQVVVHIIHGLPGEERTEMLETSRAVAALDIQGVKVHNLQIVRGTPLARAYRQGRLRPRSREEFAAAAADTLELLSPQVLVHRLAGECPKDLLLAPDWSWNRLAVQTAIERELERRGSWQGQRHAEILAGAAAGAP